MNKCDKKICAKRRESKINIQAVPSEIPEVSQHIFLVRK
jgi:hypothetical protein